MAEVTTIWEARKAGWSIVLVCDRRREGLKSVRPCLGRKAVDLSTLISAAGPDVTIASLHHRLRCPTCGSDRFRLDVQRPKSPPPPIPRTPFEGLPIKDFAMSGVKLRAMCQSCGRDRVIHGGLLMREFSAETRLDQNMIDVFVKRLKCGNCGQHNAVGELIRDEES